jgi:hypothetical protein
MSHMHFVHIPLAWDAAIGTKLGKPLLLLNVLRDVDALPRKVLAVCLLEFLEDDVSFPAIGCAPCEKLDALVGLQAGRSLVVGHVEKRSRCVKVRRESVFWSFEEASRGRSELWQEL